ncbi:sensor histidine kinase [Pseudothauera rhizosphaerae]|uniref:Sensor histidine kinase n=1 Tax=Pseudothauera rhizosphaerae TaxID=2565932 RepID=A0A4S4AX01_9RHOO|nr:histidine kinase [Pseudothauera rhizosphaerae]THF64427.1 sensor histidine kinase [Pseudothauera rhizosphaerae]
MQSIKQKAQPPLPPGGLPDFRNLGVLLRLLLLVNVLVVATALVQADSFDGFMLQFIALAGRVELPLLAVALLLYLVQPWLARRSRRVGMVLVMAAVLAVAAAAYWLAGGFGGFGGVGLQRWLLWAAVAGVLGLLYFDYRNRRLSRALSEARLMALTARIRPHFLFNSLNAVLGVIRSDPRRAERALEELADLFRVLMRENRELVRLDTELALCERYLDLERLRLGERLQVRWQAEHCPRDALVPPLLLQPLLENAVYHGIEPLAEAGEIRVQLYRRGEELRIEVENPVSRDLSHHEGNRMALDNLRERLMLFFDLEAGLESERREGRYRVRIRMPYRSAPA